METIYNVYGTCNRLLFEEENVLDYRPGGYHPVALSDTFQNHRYQVHHKLGYGGFSTVWLAWDTEYVKRPVHTSCRIGLTNRFQACQMGVS